MVQACVSDLKRVSAKNTAACNECADESQQLIVSQLMVSDLQEVLHMFVCVPNSECLLRPCDVVCVLCAVKC